MKDWSQSFIHKGKRPEGIPPGQRITTLPVAEHRPYLPPHIKEDTFTRIIRDAEEVIEKFKTVWIVGKTLDWKINSWEFQGVFSTKAKALAACRDANCFIGPAILDQELPDNPMQWLGAFYPNSKTIDVSEL